MSQRFDAGSLGGRSVLFTAVDKLEHCGEFIRGWLTISLGSSPPELMVEFPNNTPYLLMDRRNTRFVTVVEALRYEKMQSDILSKVFGEGDHVHVVSQMTPEELAKLVESQRGGNGPDDRQIPGQYL